MVIVQFWSFEGFEVWFDEGGVASWSSAVEPQREITQSGASRSCSPARLWSLMRL